MGLCQASGRTPASREYLLAYHICGNATRIVDDMTATGAAVLELDYKCDLAKIKAATAGKTTILGVIDPSGVLAFGTPDLVTQKVREELAVLAPGGGLILGPGCALAPETPPENVHALIEAGHRYGRYGADGKIGRSVDWSRPTPKWRSFNCWYLQLKARPVLGTECRSDSDLTAIEINYPALAA